MAGLGAIPIEYVNGVDAFPGERLWDLGKVGCRKPEEPPSLVAAVDHSAEKMVAPEHVRSAAHVTNRKPLADACAGKSPGVVSKKGFGPRLEPEHFPQLLQGGEVTGPPLSKSEVFTDEHRPRAELFNENLARESFGRQPCQVEVESLDVYGETRDGSLQESHFSLGAGEYRSRFATEYLRRMRVERKDQER